MIKGGFWTADIDTEIEFDPSKLQLDLMMVVEDRIHLLTGASYDGQELNPEWIDDYTSRGIVLDINYPPEQVGTIIMSKGVECFIDPGIDFSCRSSNLSCLSEWNPLSLSSLLNLLTRWLVP